MTFRNIEPSKIRMLEALHRDGDRTETTIYSSFRPIPASVADVHARQYARNYSSTPWDIYKWERMEFLAQERLGLISDLLGQKQALLISVSKDAQPVGFGFITKMDLFVSALKDKVDLLGGNYEQVTDYLKRVTKAITGSEDTAKITEVGYIADIIVDERYQGNGIGKKIKKLSLNCFIEEGLEFAIGWTVHPAMSHINKVLGGQLILNIGQDGEAIGALRKGSGVLPFLEKPLATKVVAEHYLFNLLRS
jgi:ribosomal protein S18 acetylase RimI-like enzyme